MKIRSELNTLTTDIKSAKVMSWNGDAKILIGLAKKSVALNKPTQSHQPILSARQKAITAVTILALVSAAVYYLRPQRGYNPYCPPEFCKENPHFNAAMLKRGEGPCICLEWMNGDS